MSPAKKARRRARSPASAVSTPPLTAEWALAFYMDKEGNTPGREFLLACPQSVREMLLAILVAVRDAPPPSFPASRMWHAMHGEMKGFHEARDAHDGQLYRLFCVLDREAPEHGLDARAVVIICGGSKRARNAMGDSVYRKALYCRADYLATRRIMPPTASSAAADRLENH